MTAREGLPPDPAWIVKATWQEKIILPALYHPKRSRARAEEIRRLADSEHLGPDGLPARFSEETLRNWVIKYEKNGFRGLVRKRRAEKEHRCKVTRQWDVASSSAGLSDDAQNSIAEQLNQYIADIWRSSNPGWFKCCRFAQTKLLELSIKAGWIDATLEDCKISRHKVEPYRTCGILFDKETDAKRFADEHVPRTLRDASQLKPMQVIVGDVHHTDVVVRRKDGSTATPKIIAWCDWATRRLYCTAILLEKNKGVSQADVAASFVGMVQKWGLPERQYLDHGSEFSWMPMMEGFTRLSTILINYREFVAELLPRSQKTPESVTENDPRSVIRAKPYNAPAKIIEGVFAVLEKVLGLLPGHIGGDRMNKKQPRLGKQHEPYVSFEAFERDFENALAMYNATPEISGDLSPYGKYKKHVDEGWEAAKVEFVALFYAFSEEKNYTVQNKGICINETWYQGDALSLHRGKRIKVLFAKWAPDRILILPSKGLKYAKWVERAKVYHPLDLAGAKEQQRLSSNFSRQLKDINSKTNKLDMGNEIKRHLSMLPPAPETPFGQTISLGQEVDALVESAKVANLATPDVVITPRANETKKITTLQERMRQSKKHDLPQPTTDQIAKRRSC